MRRVRTWNRSTTGDERLSGLCLLSVHRGKIGKDNKDNFIENSVKNPAGCSCFLNENCIEWGDPWLIALLSFHILVTFTCLSTRNYILLVYFSENINEVAAKNWNLFSRQQYFDSKGLFISVVFCIPILLNCMIMVIMTNLKQAQLRQRIKEMNMKERMRLAKTD
ncbi:unnamed protein product [Leptidea sinapis]|uniref:Uncharacterized protein n=1 Tax=Leptidea sinapis TaxID=189913 RepID=A0A5E4QJV7_9NEOP|nr:unnamed protein product [Leptidea sinapis]